MQAQKVLTPITPMSVNQSPKTLTSITPESVKQTPLTNIYNLNYIDSNNFNNLNGKNIRFNHNRSKVPYSCSFYVMDSNVNSKGQEDYRPNYFCVLDKYIYKCLVYVGRKFDTVTEIYATRLVQCNKQSNNWSMTFNDITIEMKPNTVYAWNPLTNHFSYMNIGKNRKFNDVTYLFTQQHFEIYDAPSGGNYICNVPACTIFYNEHGIYKNSLYIRENTFRSSGLTVLQNKFDHDKRTKAVTKKADYIKVNRNCIVSIPENKVYIQLPGFATRLALTKNQQLKIDIGKDSVGIYKILDISIDYTDPEHFKRIKPSY